MASSANPTPPSSAPGQNKGPDEEEPLDPRLEAVAAKMRKLSIVSSGLMFLGIVAVFGVILYRSLSAPSSAYPPNLTADEVRSFVVANVPGAAIHSITLDERSVFVALQGNDGPVLLEIDRATWQVVSRATF